MPCAGQVVLLQTHKAGNFPDECEDSADANQDASLFALSDGAGEGIFSREWSRLLVDSFLRDRPDLTQADEVQGWQEQCRRVWYERIAYAQLGWAHRARVDQQGAGATLLTLELTEQGTYRAQAVGDSCLFCVRAGQCQGVFPLARSADFPLQPDLFSTQAEAPTPEIKVHTGLWQPGDQFFLATDAVAHWLCRKLEAEQPIVWTEFAAQTAEQWAERIDELRRHHNADPQDHPQPLIGIANDDSTLLMIAIAPEPDMV